MGRPRSEGQDGGEHHPAGDRAGRGVLDRSRRERRRGLQGLVLLGAVLVLLLLGGTGPASAHAALRATDPEDGTVLKSAPHAITLTFTESVALLDGSLRVLDPTNHRLHIGEPRHAPNRSDTVRATLPAKLAKGTYTVAWRVVSADSHPVSGAFTFSVGKPSATTAAADTGPVENPLTGSLYDIARYLAYLAAALLIGTAAFALACRPPTLRPLRTPLRAGWWTLLGSTLVLLLLRAPYESGTGPAAAFDASALTRTLQGRPGQALLARLALLLLTALYLVRLSRRRDRHHPGWLAAGGALAVGLALTWAAAEHASAGIQVPVAMTSAVLHVLAMAVWLGGLAALLILLRRGSPPAVVVTRFSRTAFASVIVLVVTGVYQSWRGLGSLTALTETTYGRTLLTKLAAVVLLVAAAGVSRRWTAALAAVDTERHVREGVRERDRVPEPAGGRGLPAPAEGTTDAATDAPVDASADAAPAPLFAGDEETYRRGLRRSVLAEVAVGVVVLLLSTILSGTLPGRAAADAAASPGPGLPVASVTTIPFAVGKASGKVQITIDPARTGENSVQAVIYGPDGGLAAVPELRLTFTLPAQKIGPLDADLTDQGGYWSTSDVNLPIAGTWTMKATVRVSELDQVSVERPVEIKR